MIQLNCVYKHINFIHVCLSEVIFIENNYKKQGRWLITRFFLGFVFSILFLVSFVLTVALALIFGLAFLAVIFGAGGHIPDPNGLFDFLVYCVTYFWNAVGDCVEDKKIGSNMEQKREWFFRVLNKQANSEQSFSIKITKDIFGILIALACLSGGGLAGYLLINEIILGTLALKLGLFLSLGATVGLGFGILLMFAEIYKIVKSVQKHYRDLDIKEYLGQFEQTQEQENSTYKKAERKFNKMVEENRINDFISKKTSKKRSIETFTQIFNDKHQEVKLDKENKIKIFALIDRYDVDKAKKQINDIINQYRQ